jgi:glutathione synthase/RimK-type ligase-like ATP-grasp enzyme
LEAVGAPLVPSYVFYTKKEALNWVSNTEFPKVFKLKGGAGASNVRLAHTKKEAKTLIKKCFGKGFAQYRWQDHIKEEWRRYKENKAKLRDLLRPFYYALKPYPTEFSHYFQNEIGYAYFQDFVPNNSFDIRICVVGNRAFALKRMTRTGDFRASGSGNIIYDKSQIDVHCVEIAFAVNRKLKMQSVAFDFVFDNNNQPMIVEISYGYAMQAYDLCEGYWTDDMCWHKGTHFDFCGWMVENLIKK